MIRPPHNYMLQGVEIVPGIDYGCLHCSVLNGGESEKRGDSHESVDNGLIVMLEVNHEENEGLPRKLVDNEKQF